jgi:hypothetical protein
MEKNQDNFKKYRDKRSMINIKLIQKSIDNIVAMRGEITGNNVSKTTYLIADIEAGEKGITPSAISKNTIYRTLIEKAKILSTNNINSINRITDGDMRMNLFNLRVEKEKLRRENIILRELLKKYGGDLSSIDIKNYENIEKIELIKQASIGLVQRLFELGIAEYDTTNGALVLSQLGDILLDMQGYSLIIGDK